MLIDLFTTLCLFRTPLCCATCRDVGFRSFAK